MNLLYWFFVIIAFLLASIKTEKPKKYQKVSVIIPAYNEEDTVAKVVEVVRNVSFVDEIIVVNDGSSDKTKEEAIKAGAIVINHETNKGKGEALYTGYKQAECDVIAFIDADIYNLTSKKVESMIMPILLGDAEITKTKFSRVSGRVTELTAKPLLNFFFPEISFEQPLSGQFAARKSTLRKINFEKDYGVDVGIVIDADVLGISIMEIDIGEIEHDMSPLSDLNLMANEVVRTIISRANKYGRVLMIDEIGYFIRMSVVGLSLIILGLFTVFFVKMVPLAIGVIISVPGIIVKSIVIFRKTPGFSLLKSFVKIHFPLIISIIVLLLMISTFIGAAHFENGVLSIEPNSRNLIIYADNARADNSISVRGPFTVDVAIENESEQIRMPSEAMMTLGIKVNDTIQIGGGEYIVNESRDGDDDIIRMPNQARKILNLEPGYIIQNSRLKEVFDQSIVSQVSKSKNISYTEKFIISQKDYNSSDFEVFLGNVSIANSSGVFRSNSSYSIAVDGEIIGTINKPKNTTLNYGDSEIEIVFNDSQYSSTKQFVKSNQGNFFNIDI